jgi:tRNA dimethylallyltransferase
MTSGAPASKIIAVVGPTATGKSALAVELALEFGGEVVNADSRLFYRGFDIGTAKPGAGERRGIPHHLIDVLGPHESFSLAAFLDAAREAIAGILNRGRLPIVAGGTGQYVWGLLEGWDVPRVPPDAVLRRSLEQEAASSGVEALYERLRQADPEAAAKVDRRNPRRLIRAIERAAAAGQSGGHARPGKAAAPPYDALVIGLTLPRPELYERIDRRIDAMVAAGWADEVRKLLGAGVPRDAVGMSGIGYPEMAAHVAGEVTVEDAAAAAKRATRRLVRRQYNWFKLDDPRIVWPAAGPDAEGGAIALVQRWLETG